MKIYSFATGLAILTLACSARAETLSLGVTQTQVIQDNNNKPAVQVALTPESAQALGEFTSRNVGKQVTVRADGKVIQTPYIMGPLHGGNFLVTGTFTFEAAQSLATILRGSGMLTIDDDMKP